MKNKLMVGIFILIFIYSSYRGVPRHYYERHYSDTIGGVWGWTEARLSGKRWCGVESDWVRLVVIRSDRVEHCGTRADRGSADVGSDGRVGRSGVGLGPVVWCWVGSALIE
jgi:hypothetical protein